MNAPIAQAQTLVNQTSANEFRVSLSQESLRGEDADAPVLELLGALRRYHKLRDFSHQERFGTPDPQARLALSELGAVQDTLQQLSSSAREHELGLAIEASLNVNVSPALS